MNSSNSINFESRNQTIRFADDIARKVNVCYPRISSSVVDDFSSIQCFRRFRIRLGYKISEILRYDISSAFDEAESFLGKIKAFITPVKNLKLGNCGESAQLSAIVAKTNGIKPAYIASLKTAGGKSLDHSVLYVKDKKPYIIDSWLGFADYVPNAIQRYKNEFGYHFNNEDNEKMVFEELKTEYTEFLNKDFTRSQINKLRKLYPEHFIKKGLL